MYEERLLAVGFLDVFIWNTGLEVEDIVSVGAEGFLYALYFGVLLTR